jgi:hypothetical protein
MIWPIASLVGTKKRVAELSRRFLDNRDKLKSSSWLNDRCNWEISYLLLPSIQLGLSAEADAIADYLMSAQKDSQWDEATDENIESTSLVGLALSNYWKYKYGIEGLRLTSNEKIAEIFLAHSLWRRAYVEESIEDIWNALCAEKSPHTKGKLLEQFVAKYASADSTLKVKFLNLRTKSEEIDLIVENLEDHSFLKAGLILIECKFRESKTSAKQVRDFSGKLQNRKHSLCKIGLVVSISGFTKDALHEIERFNLKHDNITIVALTRQDIQSGVTAGRLLSDLLEDKISRIA